MTTRRLAHDSGTSGGLRPCGDWSVEVVDLHGPDVEGWLAVAVTAAADDGRLDLRSRVPLPGFSELAPDEHVRPVPAVLADAEATRSLGARLGVVVRPGDLLVLAGPLGAGKTTLTQGLGIALGVRGRVTSPTFVLARVHRGPVPLVHVDAYRLRDSGRLDLDDLDLDAALEAAVTVVEWGDGLVEQLADDRLEVRLGREAGTSGGDGRVALVAPSGSRWCVLAPFRG